MAQGLHEVRDPIHTFVRLDSEERRVLDSRPIQRLRNIHQLALTYQIYPGATHKRFEHSIGVMDLATRVFDTVTDQQNVSDVIRERLPTITKRTELDYWRKVLRMAALCHDIGHLPFSHAAETDLLPEGWDHERLTRELIKSNEMQEIWQSTIPPLQTDHIIKLAIGPEKAYDLEFSPFEEILSEIIVGDAFGVDRMDYLLRDSHHIGVAYGRFDHHRLVDTLRILPVPHDADGNSDTDPNDMPDCALGIEIGGIQSMEALLWARYFMYTQVYFHHVRRVYDIHLVDFLKKWCKGGTLPTKLNRHLALTDNEVNAALYSHARRTGELATYAKRICQRDHFRCIYSRNPEDVKITTEAGTILYKSLKSEFEACQFRHDHYIQRGGASMFPVKMRDDRVLSSLTVSDGIANLPQVRTDYIFAAPEIKEKAQAWLGKNRVDILESVGDNVDDGPAEASGSSHSPHQENAG